MPSTPQPQPQPCFADDCWSDEPVGQCPLEPNSFCLAGLQCLACAVPLGMSPSLLILAIPVQPSFAIIAGQRSFRLVAASLGSTLRQARRCIAVAAGSRVNP